MGRVGFLDSQLLLKKKMTAMIRKAFAYIQPVCQLVQFLDQEDLMNIQNLQCTLGEAEHEESLGVEWHTREREGGEREM